MKNARVTPGIRVGQTLHFTCLAILLCLVYWLWTEQGNPHAVAFWIAIAFPIAHQVFVWLAWRLELQSAAVSGWLGFRGYLVCFFLLFAGRFLSLFSLAWLDRGSLGMPVLPRAAAASIAGLLGLYAMYSVKRYFGMARAAGGDHFDQRFRDLPMVREGIFRFTSNGMYLYAFLLFWAVALGFNSAAALTVAAFSHVYIWVHFYATEKPDMDYLYGGR